MKLITWNCQGAASKSFLRAAKWLGKTHKPDILCLMETKTSGTNADNVCYKLGFENWVRVEALGFSGGIWILWKEDINVQVLISHPQFVHLEVKEQNEHPWNLSVVYGSPSLHLRRKLWNSLSRNRININGPWLVAGDFNAVISADELSNPDTPGAHRNNDFKNWVFEEALIDLGFEGQKLTWKRGLDTGTFKGARLDRALCSMDWFDRFRNTKVTHMAMINSDHCPILVNIDCPQETFSNTFKFQGAWLRHPNFMDTIKKNWDENATVWQNKGNLAIKLKDWNRNSFGNIHIKKRRLLRRLEGIQKHLDIVNHAGIIKLEKKLRGELEEVLHQEEILWYQQAREDWIASGDRNTNFYHAATKVRQAKKRRYQFLDDTGQQVLNEEETEKAILNYFKSIFTKDCDVMEDCALKGKFPNLSAEVWNNLNSQFTIDEVKAALLDMGPLKAPGPDGFHACFYQKAWPIVGYSVYKQFLTFMETGMLEEGMNDTLIALIPKNSCPTSASHFRPISLCNVIYKIITKALTNRIKPILKQIVGPEQSSFVPGRQITDNILVYQEVLHSMRNRHNNTGHMILKIDLEKAYDRLDWSFIRDTLTDIGMSNKWVKNIMACIESPKLNIIWNGKQLEQIIPTRGIRQGDAISPYIFVLCMERLSHIIKEEVQKGKWKGIRLNRYSPILTHLFFADDLVLFAEATQEQIMVIKECLEHFSKASGQKISLNKSQIFFSKNVNTEEANRITDLAEIPSTTNLGKYLGVPSIHGRITKQMFEPILEKIDARLDGWKMRFLTLAGRQVLAQTVLHTIPYYTMQTVFMPVGILEEIDKKIRRFLWGGTNEKQKCHLVRWEKVTRTKNEGGLGLRSSKEMNIAFMAKLGWRLLSEDSSMWARILKAKYAHGKQGMNIFTHKRCSSNAWRGIISALPTIHQGTRFVVKDGNTARFWEDAWIHDKPLIHIAANPVLNNERQLTVRDYWIENEGWNWAALNNIPRNVKDSLALIMLEEGANKDETTWTCEASGMFSITSAYNITTCSSTIVQETVWKELWKIKVPSKMKTFLWTALHDRILGNAERKRRGFTTEGECDICPGKEETTEHILRDCCQAEEVWKSMIGGARWRNERNTDFRKWLEHNIIQKSEDEDQCEWPRTFALTTWWIWRWRNERIFNAGSMEINRKIAWIREAENEVSRAFLREANMGGRVTTEKILKLCWKPSTTHHYTLNVDGSVKASTKTAGIGGVLRNEEGDWIEGFVGKSDYADPTVTEARAITKAMEWAWKRGVRDLEIQSDAKEAIRWIHEKPELRGIAREVVNDATRWCNKDWNISLRAILREQNRSADVLAMLGTSQTTEWKVLTSCPLECEEIFANDLVHATRCRRVRETT